MVALSVSSGVRPRAPARFSPTAWTRPVNCARCPRTMELLRKVPGAKTAFFSILSPHMHIPAHCGPYKGVIRCHLGLIVPNPKANAASGWAKPLRTGRKTRRCSSTTPSSTKSGTTPTGKGSFIYGRFTASPLFCQPAQSSNHQGNRCIAVYSRRQKEPRGVGTPHDPDMELIPQPAGPKLDAFIFI